MKRRIGAGVVINIAEFRENLSTVNETFYFDKGLYLREKTSNPIMLNQIISQGEGLLEDSNKNDKYFLYGNLGNLYRINVQSKKAINCLTYCLNKAVVERNPKREIVCLIRLAEALKYDSNHNKALDHFNKSLRMCEAHKIDEYLDFVLQHKGKCLMELGMLNEAEECFQKALTLRKSKGNRSLIDSTEQAIKSVREKQR